MVNPDLIDFDFISNGDSKHISDFSVIVESLLSSQLNDAQKHFFSFIIKYVMKLKTVFKNNVEEPEPCTFNCWSWSGQELSYKCHF